MPGTDNPFPALPPQARHTSRRPRLAGSRHDDVSAAPAPQRAILGLALSFFTWRTLVRERGLTPAAAVRAMVEAIGRGGH